MSLRLPLLAAMLFLASLAVAQTPATQKTDNPLYTAWKGMEGKTVTYTHQESITGGAPVPGPAREPATSTLMCSLNKMTADQVVINLDRARNAAPDTLTLPAALAADDPGCPKPAGKEDLKIGDKTYACTKYTYTTNSVAEIGRDPQGLRAQVTVWLAEGVPGGVVKRHLTLTIRASYDITETLVPAK